jgi:membrane protease YdiL (CAAX protease family)
MRNLARQYPVTVYVLVTFIFSWTLWLLMILSQKGLLPFVFATNWTGSFGPAVGAVIATALIGGRSQVNSLLKRIIQVKAHFTWYVYSLFLIVVIHALSILLFSIFTRSVLQIKLLGLNDLLMVLVYFPIIMIIGGPLGEEIGWRGFLQAKLKERFDNYFEHSNIKALLCQ